MNIFEFPIKGAEEKWALKKECVDGRYKTDRLMVRNFFFSKIHHHLCNPGEVVPFFQFLNYDMSTIIPILTVSQSCLMNQ